MDWTNRVRAAFLNASRVPDDDVVEELAQHARAMYQSARAEGCSPEEADARVADLLDRWKAEAPALRHRSRRPAAIAPPALSPSRFVGLVQDVRYAARLLHRQPRQALITIAILALGIGATTTLFSVTYGVLMKPLPWPHAGQVVVLKETRGGKAPRFGAFSNAAYVAWRENAATIENIAGWSSRVYTLTGVGDPERIRITAATATLFPVLGARPLIGAFFEEKDDTLPVIVLSERLWRERFGSDPAVLGRAVRLDDEPYTVLGVMPDGLAYPDRQARAIVPFAIRPSVGNSLTMFSAVATLRPGVTPSQAAAEGTARGRFAADTGMTTTAIFGTNGPIEIAAQPLRDALTADVRRPLILLLVAVGLLLGTATANVANLQLARTTSRSREMALRAALGADAARVMRQLLVESLLLGLGGGTAGLVLTELLHRSLPALLPANFPRADDVGVDATVLMFALVVSVGISVFFGMWPAFRVRRLSLVEALGADGTGAAGTGARSSTARSRMLIMSGQVAIACLLLVGASLLGRSFLSLLNADRGFDPTDTLSVPLSMSARMYPAPERRFAILDQILTRLTTMPGVTEAAFTSELPLTPGGSTSAFDLKSSTGEVVRVQASPRLVSPRYFSALRISTIEGRVFSSADTESSEPVVVVNQSFARHYLSASPLGTKLPVVAYGPADRQVDATVIGVVEDVRYVTGGESSQPELYYVHRQMAGRLPVQIVTLLARTSGDPAIVAASLRMVIREADARLVADVPQPLEQRLLTTLARPRLYAALLAAFAVFAVAIAAVGLFGLLSYSVSLRSRELAIRSALGARRVDILRLVLRQGLTVTIAGLGAGMVAAVSLTRLVSTQLYGVTPYDTLTFLLVPLVLLIVGVLACLIPAHRAATLDPLQVLRHS